MTTKKSFSRSYSQSGEDAIVNRILGRLGVKQPSYLDLGAYHPYVMSNTYHFYEKGCTGILVEANPQLIPDLQECRPLDTVLNIGVTPTTTSKNEVVPFYEFNNLSVSTFDEKEKSKLEMRGEKLIKTRAIRVYDVNEIIHKYCGRTPDFVSIDLEGLDYEVLRSLDVDKYRPFVFCVESIIMPEERKNLELIDLMISKGYMHYADTYINSIFVERKSWMNRRSGARS